MSNPSTAFLIGGTLAGQPLSESNWTISVEPNAPIHGKVVCRLFNQHDIKAVVPFGYTWTWGEREHAIVTVNKWIQPGVSEWDAVINLTAPATPGTYYIIFAHRGEYNMSQIFSATNWVVGSVRWHDGNDFHDMDAATLEFAHEHGYVEEWPYLFDSGILHARIATLPIKVVVGNVPSSRLSPAMASSPELSAPAGRASGDQSLSRQEEASAQGFNVHIELQDGVLKGHPSETTIIALHTTTLSDIEILLADIREMTLGEDRQTVTVRTNTGDVLHGTIKTKELVLEHSALGTLTIPLQQVLKITVGESATC